MPRNRGCRGEQWDTCDRCGREYPGSQIGIQEGVKRCYLTCWDDLTVKRRDRIIAEILSQGAQTEGLDTRFLDAVSGGEIA